MENILNEEIPFIKDGDKKKEPKTSDNQITAAKIFASLFSGIGIGLMFGVLLGMAVSPVVSATIGTLSSMLVILLGLRNKYMGVIKSLRIGAFGLFMVGGIFLGIYTRTNNFLSPSLAKMKQEYIDLGFTEQQALDFIIYKEMGLVKNNSTEKEEVIETTDTTKINNTNNSDSIKTEEVDNKLIAKNESSYIPADNNNNFAAKQHASVLYSAEVSLDDCYLLKYSDASKTTEEIMEDFSVVGGFWNTLAISVKELPEEIQKEVLLSIRDVFCSSGDDGVLEVSKCETLNEIENNSLSEILTKLENTGGIWQSISTEITKNIPTEHQKQTLLFIIKILCYD